MAVVWRHDFTGTAGTNGSAATPTTGSALAFNFSTESTLDGSGQLVGGDAYYDIPTGSMGDATIKVRWTPPSIFSGDLRLFFRADAATGVAFNTDSTALFMQGGQTIQLEDRAPANGTDSILATAGTAVAGTPIDIWIRLDGARCRVWLGANVGTPDIDVSTMSRTTGHAGLRIVGGTSSIDFIEFDDVASSPSTPPPPDPTPLPLRSPYAESFSIDQWTTYPSRERVGILTVDFFGEAAPANEGGSGGAIARASSSGTGAASVSGSGGTIARASSVGAGAASASGSGSSQARASSVGTGAASAGNAGVGGSTARASSVGTGTPDAAGSGSSQVRASSSGTGTTAASGSGSSRVRASSSGTGTPDASGSGGTTARAQSAGTGVPDASGSGSSRVRASSAGTGTPDASGSGSTRARATSAGTGALRASGGGGSLARATVVGTGAVSGGGASGGGGSVARALSSGTGAPKASGSGGSRARAIATGTGTPKASGSGGSLARTRSAGTAAIRTTGAGGSLARTRSGFQPVEVPFTRRGTVRATGLLPIPPVEYNLRDQTETRRQMQYIIDQLLQQVRSLEDRLTVLEGP